MPLFRSVANHSPYGIVLHHLDEPGRIQEEKGLFMRPFYVIYLFTGKFAIEYVLVFLYEMTYSGI